MNTIANAVIAVITAANDSSSPMSEKRYAIISMKSCKGAFRCYSVSVEAFAVPAFNKSWYCFFHDVGGAKHLQSGRVKAQTPGSMFRPQLAGLMLLHPAVTASVSSLWSAARCAATLSYRFLMYAIYRFLSLHHIIEVVIKTNCGKVTRVSIANFDE